jgi:hypothetical protein
VTKNAITGNNTGPSSSGAGRFLKRHFKPLSGNTREMSPAQARRFWMARNYPSGNRRIEFQCRLAF